MTTLTQFARFEDLPAYEKTFVGMPAALSEEIKAKVRAKFDEQMASFNVRSDARAKSLVLNESVLNMRFTR